MSAIHMETDNADVQVSREGTIYMVRPLTEAGREYLEERTDGMWFGGALAVEHRYVRALVEGLIEDGFTVR